MGKVQLIGFALIMTANSKSTDSGGKLFHVGSVASVITFPSEFQDPVWRSEMREIRYLRTPSEL